MILNKTDGLLDRAKELFCTGANRTHKAKLRVASPGLLQRSHYSILLCDWPKEEAEMGVYEVFLEDANGKSIGQLKAKYQPSLLKQYGTMSCVRNLSHDPDPHVNVSGLADLPQWFDYHHMHGVEHFIIYTTNDMSPALQEVYQPYIDEGLLTRVHLDMPADKCWCVKCLQQELILLDCLYRAKGHAKWLFPSLDVDEYVNIRSGEDITTFLEKTGAALPSGMVSFRKFRFQRTQAGVEILSPFCELAESGDPKYAANVSAVTGLMVHDVPQDSMHGILVLLKVIFYG